MKVRIKTFYGELPEYLTEGKVYIFEDTLYIGGYVLVDNKKIYIYLNNCHHLNGGSWEIVDEN